VLKKIFHISIALILLEVFNFFDFIDLKIANCGEKKFEQAKTQLLQDKDELKTLQKRIEGKKARIKETKIKEKKVVSELNRIEKDLSIKQQEYKSCAIKLKEERKKIEETNNEIKALQADVNKQEANLAHHLKTLYKLSRIDMSKVFFFSDSFPELMRNQNYMIRMVVYNLDVINKYSETIEKVKQREKFLKTNQKKLIALAEKAGLAKKKIAHHKKKKAAILSRVRAEKELHLGALAELKQASRRLQALIDKLEKGIEVDDITGSESFSFYKKKLGFPVSGKVISYFGKNEDPEFSTISFNKGIEIVADEGSEIEAIFDGKVIYSDWFKGYGNIVIIDHGGGYYTISGHASDLFKKVGEQVNKGEAIGLVGDTGSLKGSNLYFEIRHHGQPLDPLNWLKKNK